MSNKLYENPVFICGHRKTGTTLLLCLLDNHPELLVYPPDSVFFYGYYPKYDSDEYSADDKINRMLEYVLHQIEYEVKILPEDFQKEINFPFDKFKNDFKALALKTDLKPKDMLKCLFESYRMNWNGSPEAKLCVEKTSSTEIYANEIIKWFPNAKFIHIIRDPRDNWASLKSGWEKRYKDFNDELNRLMQSMIERGRLGLEMGKNNLEFFGDEVYKIIRYEDLTENPEAILKQLCEFLNISYHSSLEIPTVCGQLWKGNNFDGLTFNKPSNINVGKWRERITTQEAQLLEFYFTDIMNHFGYETAFPISERLNMATQHYKWFNFIQLYSGSTATPE